GAGAVRGVRSRSRRRYCEADMDIPAPAARLVAAARQHLSKRYASGVDRVLWEAEQRPMPDPAAVRAVIAAGSGAEALDIASSLILVQVIRQGVDALEFELFEAVRAAGITDAAVAAVLGLSGEAAAQARQQWLSDRQAEAVGLSGSAAT